MISSIREVILTKVCNKCVFYWSAAAAGYCKKKSAAVNKNIKTKESCEDWMSEKEQERLKEEYRIANKDW